MSAVLDLKESIFKSTLEIFIKVMKQVSREQWLAISVTCLSQMSFKFLIIFEDLFLLDCCSTCFWYLVTQVNSFLKERLEMTCYGLSLDFILLFIIVQDCSFERSTSFLPERLLLRHVLLRQGRHILPWESVRIRVFRFFIRKVLIVLIGFCGSNRMTPFIDDKFLL